MCAKTRGVKEAFGSRYFLYEHHEMEGSLVKSQSMVFVIQVMIEAYINLNLLSPLKDLQ